jgi:hypothetical protein
MFQMSWIMGTKFCRGICVQCHGTHIVERNVRSFEHILTQQTSINPMYPRSGPVPAGRYCGDSWDFSSQFKTQFSKNVCVNYRGRTTQTSACAWIERQLDRVANRGDLAASKIKKMLNTVWNSAYPWTYWDTERRFRIRTSCSNLN